MTISTRDAAGNNSSVTLNLNLAARVTFKISSFTPLNGANDVGATYRPQVFFSRPVNPASLNANNFYATGPDGTKLAANIVPAGDGSFAWLFFANPMPGASQITVHLDGSTIQAAADGVPLDADDDGTAGGTFTFQFSTVSLTPLIGTSLSGKVLDVGPDLKPMTFDDIRVGPDQIMHTADDVFLLPIAGVRVSIIGLPDAFTFTDSTGSFHFDSVPAGDVKLAIDGRTATNAPAGIFFPEMVMDLQIEAGRANTVMGTMGTADEKAANRNRQEVYLPRLETSILQNVSNTAPTNITVNADAAANLTAQQRSMLTLTVQPGSLRDQNGNVVTAGQVGISTVPPSLVRDMLPPGLLQHTFDITVQAPGITNFATPAPMTFPNLFGAAPGTKLNFLSFDHTTGRLVIEGTATVSADGLSVSTDPGTGITHPGWHGLTPQGSPTSPDKDDDGPQGDELSFSIIETLVPDLPQQPQQQALAAAKANLQVAGFSDWLLTDDKQRVHFEARNLTDRNANIGSDLMITITVDPATSGAVLDGLHTESFLVHPGKTQAFDFTIKAPEIKTLTNDLLIGAKYHVDVFQLSPGDVTTKLNGFGDYYVYRYVDAMDDNAGDAKLKFAPTINDLAGGHVRTRELEYQGDPDALPTLKFGSLTHPENDANFDQPQFTFSTGQPTAVLTFDPKVTKDDIKVTLNIRPPGTERDVVGTREDGSGYRLQALGSGVDKRKIYLNIPGLIAQLEEFADGITRQDIVIGYILKPGQTKPTGQFVLKYGTDPSQTLRLAVDADPKEVEDALEPLSGIGLGNVKVTLTEGSSTKIETGAKQGQHFRYSSL